MKGATQRCIIEYNCWVHKQKIMLDKLDAIKARFEQLGVALTNPEIISNQKEFGKLS